MRRVAVLLLAVFLVNLPFVHETLTERRVRDRGREVAATVLEASSRGGRNFVDYRLPESIDPQQSRFTARVDDATYAAARSSRTLPVRVVPGDPAANRAAGQVPSRLFLGVAVIGDVVLLGGAFLYWRRRRTWLLHEVVEVLDDAVVLRREGREVTAAAPAAWLARIRPGEQVPGSLHLVADRDVLPGGTGEGLEQLLGSSYAVCGRVVDARAGLVHLDAGAAGELAVQTGEHRMRAGLRDLAETVGLLCFTPS